MLRDSELEVLLAAADCPMCRDLGLNSKAR